MNKLLLLFLLVPTLLFADINEGFVYVTQSKEKIDGKPKYIFYIQSNTINYTLPNNMVRYWVKVNNYKSGESMREYVEGDCRNKTTRSLRFDLFEKHNFEGEVERDETPERDVTYVVPNSINDSLLKTVCAYREKKLEDDAKE